MGWKGFLVLNEILDSYSVKIPLYTHTFFQAVMPYLTALADFRDSVRKEAIPIKASNILKTCDSLRDDVLPELRVRIMIKQSFRIISLFTQD